MGDQMIMALLEALLAGQEHLRMPPGVLEGTLGLKVVKVGDLGNGPR